MCIISTPLCRLAVSWHCFSHVIIIIITNAVIIAVVGVILCEHYISFMCILCVHFAIMCK